MWSRYSLQRKSIYAFWAKEISYRLTTILFFHYTNGFSMDIEWKSCQFNIPDIVTKEYGQEIKMHHHQYIHFTCISTMLIKSALLGPFMCLKPWLDYTYKHRNVTSIKKKYFFWEALHSFSFFCFTKNPFYGLCAHLYLALIWNYHWVLICCSASAKLHYQKGFLSSC